MSIKFKILKWNKGLANHWPDCRWQRWPVISMDSIWLYCVLEMIVGDICYQIGREILGQWFMFEIYIIRHWVPYYDIDLYELENTIPRHYRDNKVLSSAILLARINWISMEIWMDLYKGLENVNGILGHTHPWWSIN